MLKTGILGINARNLLYLKPFNTKKAIQLADNKLKTKQFLGARNIPVAKLYGVIRTQKELERFDWSAVPKNFVVKPNRGYGGEGFRAVHDFTGTDAKIIKDLHDHIIDILDGNYSLSNAPDFALIEQEIVPNKIFAPLSTHGLPDIRIIVFNLVPVMAMLRLPTKESGGVANLHQGGAIIGLDIATGEALQMFYRGKFVDRLPDSTKSIEGFKVPSWDEMLLIASKTQVISNVGYLAIDIVLDQRGQALVLELNARGGLGIQIANLAPLRQRLERVRGIKVTTPEKGVRMGKDLFGRRQIDKAIEKISGRHILGAVEPVELLAASRIGGMYPLMARVNPSKLTSSLDRTIASKLGLASADSSKNKGFVKAEFILGGERIKTAVSLKDYSKADYQMIVGQRDLREFLIDPTRTVQPLKRTVADGVTKTSPITNLLQIDARVVEIDRALRLLTRLQPINAGTEAATFFAAHGEYNPQFTYAHTLRAEPLLLQLARLKPDTSPIGQLLQKKIEEIRCTIQFIESIGTPGMTAQSRALYGAPSEETYVLAQKELAEFKTSDMTDTNVPIEQVITSFRAALHRYDLTHWNIVIKESMASDCAVGKVKTIFIRKDAVFSQERVESLIAHEIETHILTAENGNRQPYKLFAQGCAGYLMTQEGLAIYNQERERPRSEKYYWPAAATVAVSTALGSSFIDTYKTLRKFGFPEQRAYGMTLRVKRGLTNTAEPGACTRSYVYFAGRQMIESFVRDGGKIADLYIGKIALADLPVVHTISGIQPPRYLPAFLRDTDSLVEYPQQ